MGLKLFKEKEPYEFIMENYVGIGPSEMAAIIREKFGETVTADQMKGFYARNKLNSGVSGYFSKGHVPWNKNMKGWKPPGAEKTWFTKGHLPVNRTLPVGSEATEKGGYLYVKVAMPNVWKSKHQLIWEQHNGPMPKGHVIVFRDRNIRNFDPENLMLISRAELAVMNHELKWSDDPTINTTKKHIATLKTTVSKIAKTSQL